MHNAESRRDTHSSSGINVGTLRHFLTQNGWRHIADYNDNLNIFEGPSDDLGRPIELVLPTRGGFIDEPRYLSKALKLLSAIERCSIEQMTQKILKS